MFMYKKPWLSTGDLHLIAKLVFFDIDQELTAAEMAAYDRLDDVLGEYLTIAVGPDWDSQEAAA